MNTYIQNKLDEFDDNKFFKILNIPTDKVYAEKDGLRFDLQEINIKEVITEAYNQGKTDYHNHIVEKIMNLVKTTGHPYMFSLTEERFEKDLRSLLQDTNPKE